MLGLMDLQVMVIGICCARCCIKISDAKVNTAALGYWEFEGKFMHGSLNELCG